jgi:cell fate (sporulation/competence/biofilm development) regulator YlbF (YheA/YmcA/DUF963 family)
MDEILDLAARLGKRISQDPRAGKMVDAQVALENSLADRQLLADYEQQQQKVYELEASGRPIEPDDKRKLAELHAKVVGSGVIKEVLKAQADFLEIMNSVSQRIEQEALSRMGGSAQNTGGK